MKSKKFIWKTKLMLIATVFVSIYSCNQSSSNDIMNPSGFEIKHGVNLSHWLSQDYGWAPKYAYIVENDLKFIDSIGYDHVRIPIEEMEMWDENGIPIQEAFDHLRSCLNWCNKYKLRAIVDLHIIRTHYNEGGSNTLWVDSAAQNKFINLWVQLSEVLHEYPTNMVAYELLNEVIAPKHDDWNELLGKTAEAIRELEPERVLIICPNMWHIASNLQFLELPENDKNIILTFHAYSPLAFTHYNVNWTPAGDYKGPVHYPGQIITDEDYTKYVDTTNIALVEIIADSRDYFDKQRLIEEFKSGIAFAKSKNLQLYCGEFGCLPTVKRKDRLQFYSDLIEAFEENDIAWCNWEYKGDFGIYHFDIQKKISLSPDTELIEILLPKD